LQDEYWIQQRKKVQCLKRYNTQLIIKGIVAEAIEVRSTSKNNKLPYGYLSTVVKKYSVACP
jgi:hypothetical protein